MPVDGDIPTHLKTTQPPALTLREGAASPRTARLVDYAKREAANRSLGLAGERLVVEHYRRVLRTAGRTDLAKRVRHVAVEDGDGLGYDIHGFDTDGSDLFVEVKTTRAGARTPFFLSANEVRASREHGRTYRLVRVYDFEQPQGPNHYVLLGPLDEVCDLQPATYRAVPDARASADWSGMGAVEYLPDTDSCTRPTSDGAAAG